MHIKKLKVKPRKNAPFNPCAPELLNMLACWSATTDLHSKGPCADAAKAVMDCMRTTPFAVKGHRPTINYHLSRLNKNLK